MVGISFFSRRGAVGGGHDRFEFVLKAVDAASLRSGRKLPFVEAKGKPDFASEKDDEVESAWLCRRAKRADVLTVSECGRAWTMRDPLIRHKGIVFELTVDQTAFKCDVEGDQSKSG